MWIYTQLHKIIESWKRIVFIYVGALWNKQASKPLSKAYRALDNALSESGARKGPLSSNQNISEWAEGKLRGKKDSNKRAFFWAEGGLYL